jgi:lysophosphatidate acyltransferase
MMLTWDACFALAGGLCLLRLTLSRSSYLRYYVRITSYLGIIVLFAIACTPITIVFAALGRRFESGRIVTHSFYEVISRVLGIRIEFEGSEHLAVQPAVYMLNHQSILDVWLLGRSDDDW